MVGKKKFGNKKCIWLMSRSRKAAPPINISSTECCFCKGVQDPGLGTFFQDQEANLAAHQFCLLFSCGLPQAGTDKDGFEGFLYPDIYKEVRRVRRFVCRFCLRYGASSGCFIKSCPFTYHYKCGLLNDAQFDFYGTFNTFCYAHRSFQDMSYILNGSNRPACPICLDDIDESTASILKMPCCKNVFAHKGCVQNQAMASGYFFRCPTCKNEKEFKREMSRYGIYIPLRDASWEENNAYSDLLQQYTSCDLPSCQCPMGKNYEEEHGKWKLIRCYHCGQGAVHRHCLGKRFIAVYGYICRDCNQVTGLLKGFTFSPEKSKQQTLEQKRLIQEHIAKGDPLFIAHTLTPRKTCKRFNVKPCRVEITRLPKSVIVQYENLNPADSTFEEEEEEELQLIDISLEEPNEMDEIFFGNGNSSSSDYGDDSIPATIFKRKKIKRSTVRRRKRAESELDTDIFISFEEPNELDDIFFGCSTASSDSDSDFHI